MRKVVTRVALVGVLGAVGYAVAGGVPGVGALDVAAPSWLPGVGVGGLVLLALGAVGRAVRSRARWSGQQDPVRMYPAALRAEVFARAGGQCEYTGWAWQRCRAKAEHADHIIPWSKGGATSLQNGAASCAHHNTSKGARLLTRGQLRALERRRRRYFPPGAVVKAGQLYGEPAEVAPAPRGAASVPQRPAPRAPAPAAVAAQPPAGTRAWERPTPNW